MAYDLSDDEPTLEYIESEMSKRGQVVLHGYDCFISRECILLPEKKLVHKSNIGNIAPSAWALNTRRVGKIGEYWTEIAIYLQNGMR